MIPVFMIYIGADHGGYQIKEKLKDFLADHGFNVTDMGTDSEQPVDYPLIADKVARKVAEDPNNRGILICKSGAGVCITANKINGIRAAETWSAEVAKAARNDDNANVACFAAAHLSEGDIKEIAQVFLSTSFGGAERYKRRLKQIEEVEKNPKII